ncbi:MAG TPA: hypothetical protein GXX30_06360 [Firmicutes bacterium]|nr:hypothetical protein [Candidatus Fermentithermobacillaceae bacterium]
MLALSGQCVVGIDGGTFSTKAALMREGLVVLAEGRGGPTGHFSGEIGKDRLERALREATASLSSFLEEHPELSLKAVFLGLTGVFIPGKKEAAQEILSEVFPGCRVMVESDALIAWAGALAGQSGIAVVAGTGSVAYGRDADGREVRKGGFGYLFADEGGAFHVACEGIKAVLKHHDGVGPPTSLSEVLKEHFQVTSVREIVGKVYSEDITVEEIAAISPLIAREASFGDPVCLDIMERAGKNLGRLAVSALKEMGSSVRLVSYAGGMFNSGEVLLRPFKEEIQKEVPDALIIPPRYPPVIGAGILAWNPALYKPGRKKHDIGDQERLKKG